MRVICPNCQSKALITSSSKLTDTIFNLYCSCKNTKECGATFVYTLAFDHYLNLPNNTTKNIALNILRNLPKEELKELLK